MRAWKVFEVKGKPTQLEIELNKIQKDGFEILAVNAASFGFLVIAFLDQPSDGMPSPTHTPPKPEQAR